MLFWREINSVFHLPRTLHFLLLSFNECFLFLVLRLALAFFALIFVQILLYLFIKVYFFLWSILVFIKRGVYKKVRMVLEKRKSCMQKSGTKRSLFRLRLRLLHVMFYVILIVCLVIFVVAWLVSNDWDCLMSLWKNHVLFLLYESIYLVFSFDALFGLTWRMLTPCWLQNKTPIASMII
jgi:hypothetical protein